MPSLSGPYEMYREDRQLCVELGLRPLSELPHAEEVRLGKVKVDQGSVEIFLNAWPALFCRFVIITSEDKKKYELTTGSGTLSHFWPMAMAMAQNMLVVKQI